MARYWSLSRYPYWSYDTETTGLEYPTSRVFGFSVATPDGRTGYYDVRRQPKSVAWLMDEAAKSRRIICHNASYDFRMSHVSGIRLPIDALDDTQIRACLLDEHVRAYDLDTLGLLCVNLRKHGDVYADLAELFGGAATRKAQIGNLQFAPPRIVGPYAEQDALICLRLWEWQEKEIEAQDAGYQKAPLRPIVEFERKLMPTVIRREMHGIRVDVARAEEAADKLVPIVAKNQARLNELAGWEVNVNSSPQIKKIFAPEEHDGEWWVKDTRIGTTEKGGPSLGAEFLREINSEESRLILDIRSDIKTRDTFLLGHVVGHSHEGRVYPSINQNKGEDGGTGSGRFSYTNPALQQIPSRNKVKAAIVKPCFLPDTDDEDWYDLDLDSFEFRVFAHLVNNARMVRAYEENPDLDIHQYVAELTRLPRNAPFSGGANAKQLNLSMVFNSGRGATAEKMGMEWWWESFTARSGELVRYKKPGPDAERIIDRYHRRVPGVHDLAERCKRMAEKRGFVRTKLGRRLRFPNGWKSYKASGLLIQATSADLNKENWMRIEDVMGGGEFGRMLLNTHDSYGLSLTKDKKKAANIIRAVRNTIEYPGRIRVPLRISVAGPGADWWDAIRNDT